MALKKGNKVNPNFSMQSMTDIIFLLLLFFMITSTLVNPNAIKVLLPQSKKQTSAKQLTRVTIDAQRRYYVAYGKQREQEVGFEEITPFLQECAQKDNEMYIALYADESIPYSEVVRVLNIATENNFKMVLATRPKK